MTRRVLACPSCGRVVVRTPTLLPGRRIRCRGCGRLLRVKRRRAAISPRVRRPTARLILAASLPLLLLLVLSAAFVLTGGHRPAHASGLDAPESASTDEPSLPPEPVAAVTRPAPPAPSPKKLLVVAPSAFRGDLAPFIEHKQKLLPTELVALETALKEGRGADDAERLKRYLYGRWKAGDVGYVLLVGDPEVMPVRYTAVNNAGPEQGGWSFAPSDLYFADLARRDGTFEDWNGRTDGFHAGYYGELMGFDGVEPINADGIDYLPEVALGRWPVHTSEQVRTVVAKTIRYEDHVLADDLPAVRRAAFVNGPGLADVRGQMSDWARELQDVTSTPPTRLLYKDAARDDGTPPPTAEEVGKVLDDGVGMIFHVGHGSETSWDGCLDLGGLAGIKNAELPPVMFSVGCTTARFTALPPGGPYLDDRGRAHEGINAGETFGAPAPPPGSYQPGPFARTSLGVEFVRAGANGAVAYVGCATGSQSCAWPMVGGFVDYLHSHDAPRLGDAWAAAVASYYRVQGLASLGPRDWWQVAIFDQGMTFQLFGDPSLQLLPPPAGASH